MADKPNERQCGPAYVLKLNDKPTGEAWLDETGAVYVKHVATQTVVAIEANGLVHVGEIVNQDFEPRVSCFSHPATLESPAESETN